MIKYQFLGTQVLNAYTVVKCYKVIPGNNITIESTDNKVHSMPIGTVFSHVSSNPPAGAVLLSGQPLAKSDYPEFYNWVKTNKDNIRVITDETYEEEIDKYGFCGAFVINENEVKLPNYKNAFLMGADASNNGTEVAAGLPNIKTTKPVMTGSRNWFSSYDGGCIVNEQLDIVGAGGGAGNDRDIGINFDASRSNPIYGNSDTVQPPAICVNYYIQVYNSTYTPTNVEAALKDLSNVTAPTQAFRELVMSWCIPDYSATASIEQPENPSKTLQRYEYKAPCNGFFCYDVLGFNTRYAQIMVNDVSIFNNASPNELVYWNINRNDTCSKR